MTDSSPAAFAALSLPTFLLEALQAVGYEQPSPIQEQCIPHLLNGKNLLGLAQTGTGKTAAFALPLLARIDLALKAPQVLVLAPTRELAIQVSEAFQRYATKMKGFHVLPVYGGQDYRTQLRALKRGPQVVVGTPGRIMDHLRRGTLELSSLQAVVLDEADEMLRMGFIDDVTWIMEQMPEDKQVALFSATMPAAIKKVTEQYLHDPEVVQIKAATKTVDSIEQQYWMVKGTNKLDALTRILEAENFDAIVIFVRTKHSTEELAERLEARGYAASAINGDMNQAAREQVINRLKKGKLDILVATDVAARGIDVPRISHVINYDIPYDNEAYVHRIGRTGRAGKSGKAILFVAPREQRLLRSIEKSTGQKIDLMQLPTREEVAGRRIEKFQDLVRQTIDAQDLEVYRNIVSGFVSEGMDEESLQAALLYLAQKDRPIIVQQDDRKEKKKERKKREAREFDSMPIPDRKKRKKEQSDEEYLDDIPREVYRLKVGKVHGAQPSDIVGAIANEAELDSEYIGQIKIYEDTSTVELPEGMPKEIFRLLQNTRVRGERLMLEREEKGRKGEKKQAERKHPDRNSTERKPGKKKQSEERSTGKRKDNRASRQTGKKRLGEAGKPPKKRHRKGGKS